MLVSPTIVSRRSVPITLQPAQPQVATGKFSELSTEDRLDVLLTTTVAVNTKLQDKIEKVLVEQRVEKDAEMAEMLAVSPARSSATYQYGDGSASESSSAPNSTHSTGSAGHPHCLSPAGSLARRVPPLPPAPPPYMAARPDLVCIMMPQ